MTTTCAICDLLIVAGQGFLLDGSEVIHVMCARRGGATAMQRLRRELEIAQAQVVREHRTAQEFEIRARDQTDRARRAESAARADTRTITALRRDLEAALRERDAARAEAALHQAISAVTPVVQRASMDRAPEITAPPRSVQPSAGDARDDTEIRMSLLELDPT